MIFHNWGDRIKTTMVRNNLSVCPVVEQFFSCSLSPQWNDNMKSPGESFLTSSMAIHALKSYPIVSTILCWTFSNEILTTASFFCQNHLEFENGWCAFSSDNTRLSWSSVLITLNLFKSELFTEPSRFALFF